MFFIFLFNLSCKHKNNVVDILYLAFHRLVHISKATAANLGSKGPMNWKCGGGLVFYKPSYSTNMTKRKHRARKPVPNRSPSAVRYGMEKLSGSRPFLHIKRTIRSAV